MRETKWIQKVCGAGAVGRRVSARPHGCGGGALRVPARLHGRALLALRLDARARAPRPRRVRALRLQRARALRHWSVQLFRLLKIMHSFVTLNDIYER